ncbi:probable RNA-dependent RNA polymerase 1 [Orbicella faveolata]|uniref:probable RNA-dependent RNA polymerase 1 n=1 Tax=Orbicella faveolata TaxID=48498 RepID=UPI0009E2E916|nr:probable RNA-dependent RNA polymerase 1 [Orbicella faveolata]
MSYHFCIGLSAASTPPETEEGETCIIHVQFHGTGRNDYRVDHEKLERTFLTEYLKTIEGPDFNQKLMKLTFDIKPSDEMNSFCKSVLERGIFCRQHSYFFLGHSDEQLKTKSCYLMRATPEEIQELLAKFGDFFEEKNLGKRARKIGMLFSKLNNVVPLATKEYKVQPDIKGGITRSYTFTDGCGFMSPEFSSEVQRVFELDYQPSAVHVRYRGIEGMLVLKEDLADVKVLFHNSMQKFVTPDENMPEGFSFADVVDYSRPYVNGYLDTRMAMLLYDRGVSAQNLYDLQTGYHELLEGMCKETAEYFVRFKGDFRLLRDIQDKGIDSTITEHLKDLRKQELDEMEKAAYTRILVPKSRLVFAVCDPYKKLEYGECYFNPTTMEDNTRGFITDQKFVVMRDPCYHPGDVRVLKMTREKQGYENLRDCLVLPVEGPRPHAFECFGGDLAGNKFFVSWDKNLTPSLKENPCDYSPTVAAQLREASAKSVSKTLEKFRKGHRSKELKYREEMLEYFATFSDEILRMTEGEYMRCATELGPSAKHCRQLSKLLYQAASLSEDNGKLRKELEQKKPSVKLALNSGSPNDQEIWKNIDKRAKDFVERMQRRIDKSQDGRCAYEGAKTGAKGKKTGSNTTRHLSESNARRFVSQSGGAEGVGVFYFRERGFNQFPY